MVIGIRKDGKGAVEERIRDSIATIFSKDGRCSHPGSLCPSCWYRGMAEMRRSTKSCISNVWDGSNGAWQERVHHVGKREHFLAIDCVKRIPILEVTCIAYVAYRASKYKMKQALSDASSNCCRFCLFFDLS